jgi:hypothetical protein
MSARNQPIRQDGESLPARTAPAASHSDPFVLIVMRDSHTLPVSDDGAIVAERTSSRQSAERNYPGSQLSFASGSEITRITAGVKACR